MPGKYSYYAGKGSTFTGTSNFIWEKVPGLEKTIELTKRSVVKVTAMSEYSESD